MDTPMHGAGSEKGRESRRRQGQKWSGFVTPVSLPAAAHNSDSVTAAVGLEGSGQRQSCHL